MAEATWQIKGGLWGRKAADKGLFQECKLFLGHEKIIAMEKTRSGKCGTVAGKSGTAEETARFTCAAAAGHPCVTPRSGFICLYFAGYCLCSG